jgi:hypothetical protein
MKKTIWMSAVVLVLTSLAGCGGKDQTKSAPTPPSSTPQNTTQAAAPTKTVTVAATTPEEAVGSFLNALQAGDKNAAAALLTTKAREQTAAHDMVVEPPGAPNATYKVGRTQQPADNPDAAYVSCVWSEKFKDGNEESYEVVWVLRRETPGWRVAGMATQLADSDQPVFLDFEDPAAMEETVEKAGTTPVAPVGDRSAQAPPAGTGVR